jgi:Cys-rich protein (TIGR01571 family)
MGTLSSKECMCGGEGQIATLAHLVTLFVLPLAGTFMQCFGRSAIRKKYEISVNSCSDFICSCFCGCCTLIQVMKYFSIDFANDRYFKTSSL